MAELTVTIVQVELLSIDFLCSLTISPVEPNIYADFLAELTISLV